MIQANELRVCNWVLHEDDKPMRVATINLYKCDLVKDSIWEICPTPHILPIPLTPEILEKCGFQKVKGKFENSIFHLDLIRILLTADMENMATLELPELYGKPDLPKRTILEAPIKYLHQLQNLYFALTGKELEVNL